MSKSLIVKTFEHEGQPIDVSFTQEAFFNATQVAKAFGKMPKDWLKTDETQAYINAIRRKILIEENQLVRVVSGAPETGGGTWLHPKLGVAFARWLNVDFALWCDEIIEGILKGDVSPPITAKPKPNLDAFKAASVIARGLKALGLDKILTPNAFALSVDTTVRKVTSASALEMSGNLHLMADEKGRVYTPTELGQMLAVPIKARQFNLALEAVGLQKREMGEWMPTDDAKGLFEWADTAKRHSNGTPVKQLRWFKAVLSRLPNQQEAA